MVQRGEVVADFLEREGAVLGDLTWRQVTEVQR